MNDSLLKPKETCVCYCSGTTQTKIEELIANEVNTLEKIAYATGATTGCGACEYYILQLIAQGN